MKKFNEYDSNIEEYIKYFNEVYVLDKIKIEFNFIQVPYEILYNFHGTILFIVRKRFVLGKIYNQFVFFNIRFWNMLISKHDKCKYIEQKDEIFALSKILDIKIDDIDY